MRKLFFNLGLILISLVCLQYKASAAFYTVTQNINIPGLPGCQIILVSVYDDMETKDRSDDRHMRTDAFINCLGQINQWPGGNFSDTGDGNFTAAVLPGRMRVTLENIVTGDFVDGEKVDFQFLLELADLFDTLSPEADRKPYWDLLEKAPASFKEKISYSIDNQVLKKQQGFNRN